MSVFTGNRPKHLIWVLKRHLLEPKTNFNMMDKKIVVYLGNCINLFLDPETITLTNSTE